MMHLGRLRLLSELSVLGTISAVAEAVRLTRPAVSRQLDPRATILPRKKMRLFVLSAAVYGSAFGENRITHRITPWWQMPVDRSGTRGPCPYSC